MKLETRLTITIIGVSVQVIALIILCVGNIYIANAFFAAGSSIAWFLFTQLQHEVLKKK